MALFVLGGAASDGVTHVFSDHIKMSAFSNWELQGFSESANRFGRPGFLENTREVSFVLTKHAKKKVWDDAFVSRIVTPGPSFLTMLRLLRETMAILAHEPILVDTGQYQPKYTNRTYQDMENQIARDLANSPNYTAKVKIVNAGEYTIKTKPAPQGLTGTALAERIEAVKRHCRALGYTRHYTEVIEQARKRQEYLLGLEETPDEDIPDATDDPDEPPPGSFTLD
jgi:hypothetical protein